MDAEYIALNVRSANYPEVMEHVDASKVSSFAVQNSPDSFSVYIGLDDVEEANDLIEFLNFLGVV